MPYKHHQNRRHKFTKAKYKVTNWRDYSEALCQRGDMTIWLSDDSVDGWLEPKEHYIGRGRPKKYSDIAVQTSLMIRQVYSLPLRQTQGFLRSISQLMNLDLPIMNYSNLSKRSGTLEFKKLIDSIKPSSHVIVDSTRLKVYGNDEWQQEKYNILARRTWRKLHIAV